MLKDRFVRRIPNKDTIHLIMHTSGTTNEPKGAMLSHGNFLSGISHSDFLGFDFNDEDVYLSYVPFSHIQEQTILSACIVSGFTFGFLTPTR